MANTAKRNMWREKIEQCLTSGMSNKEWCHLNRVNLSTFYYWTSKLKKEEPGLFASQSTAEWVEITKEALAARVALVPTSKGIAAPACNDRRHDGPAVIAGNVTSAAAPVICVCINGVEMSIFPGSLEPDIANVFKAAKNL